MDFDSIQREGDWLYYNWLIFGAKPEPSKAGFNAGTNLVFLDMRQKIQVSCSRKLSRTIEMSTTRAVNKPLWKETSDEFLEFQETDNMFRQFFETLLCSQFDGNATELLQLLQSVDQYFQPEWSSQMGRLWFAYMRTQIE